MNLQTLYRLRLAESIAAGSVSPMMVFPIGEWHSSKYPDLPLTEDLANELIANFEAGVLGTEPVVDSSGKHDTSVPAAGWVKRVYLASYEEGDVTGLALWADVKWTALGATMLSDEQYKYGSVEIGPVVLNDSGETVDNVLRSLTLTNTPVLRLMPDVQNAADKQRVVATLALSEFTLTTTHEDDGTPAELHPAVSDAGSHSAKGDEGQTVTLDEGHAAPKGVDHMNPKTLSALKLAEGADEAAFDAAVLTLSEERDAEKTRADAAELRLAEQEKAAMTEAFEAKLAEALAETDGAVHMLPGEKDAYLALAETNHGAAMTAVQARIDGPAVLKLGAIGTGSEGDDDEAKPADVELAEKSIARSVKDGITIDAAQKLTLAEDPELAKRIHTERYGKEA